MAKLILKKQKEILLKGEIKTITPLGFECDIALSLLEQLREPCGRYCLLNFELELIDNSGPVSISGNASVFSLRRASQSLGHLTARFHNLEQGAYRIIAEHLNPEKVVNLSKAKNKRLA